MNDTMKLDKMKGEKILNITHSLNLTCFVIGDTYEVQMDCPWVLLDTKNSKPIVASGDLFANPQDLRKFEGDISKWKTKYTLLDENLSNLRNEKLIIEKISVLEFGDLEIVFYNDMQLRTFADFSDRRFGWWILEEGEKIGDCFSGKFQKPKKKKNIECAYWSKLVGGQLIEIGRKKEEMLKNAPNSWMKFCVSNKIGEQRIFAAYFYCPWRICNQKKGQVLIGTSDLRPTLCWDEQQSPVLRENDAYDEKKYLIETMDLRITEVSLSEQGNVKIKFGDEFIFQSFVSNSGDGVEWRGYSLGEKEYYEGGAGFAEYHQGGYSENPEAKTENADKYLKIFIGKTLKSISRRGTFYSFKFFGSGMQKLELVCADQWRIKDTETNNIIVGGGDCRFPNAQYEKLENIDWKTTINTKFEENYQQLLEHRMVVTDIKVNKHGDLKIFFSGQRLFEYVVNASFCSEEWQVRENENVRLRAFANNLRVAETMDAVAHHWLDEVKFPENDIVLESGIKSQKRDSVEKGFEKISDLAGKIWSPDLLAELSLPWRLYDFSAEKIVFGTGDLYFPDYETEWVTFFEENGGTSLLEKKWEGLKTSDLYIQAAEALTEGDYVIYLSNNMQCCIFNNWNAVKI